MNLLERIAHRKLSGNREISHKYNSLYQYLYLAEVLDIENCYKVGITSNYQQRISNLRATEVPYGIFLVFQGKNVWCKEGELLHNFPRVRHRIKTEGFSELMIIIPPAMKELPLTRLSDFILVHTDYESLRTNQSPESRVY